MLFKVDQKAFLEELSLAMGAVENKATIPVAGLIHFKFSGKFLILTTTNIDLAIKSRVPVEFDASQEPAPFCVPAARLYDWLSKAPSGQLLCGVNKRFSAKTGKSSCSIAIVDSSNFPELPAPGKPIVTVPAPVIGSVFRKASVVIPAVEEGAFNYAAANLTITSDGLTVGATNGRRLSYSAFAQSFPVERKVQILVAKKFATEAAKLAARAGESQVRIYSGQNHIYFGFGDRLLYSRALAGTFPDLSRVLPKDETQKVVSFDSAEAVSALLRVATFSEHDGRSVLIEANGQLKFSATSDAGDGSESIDAQYSGEPISIGLNASWVVDGLRAIEGIAEMRFVNSKSPVEFRASGDSGFRYLVAPMYK